MASYTYRPEDYNLGLAMLAHEAGNTLARDLKNNNMQSAYGQMAGLLETWINRAAAQGTTMGQQMAAKNQLTNWSTDPAAIARKAASVDPRIKELYDAYLYQRGNGEAGFFPQATNYLNRELTDALYPNATYRSWYDRSGLLGAYGDLRSGGRSSLQQEVLYDPRWGVPQSYEFKLDPSIRLNPTEGGIQAFDDFRGVAPKPYVPLPPSRPPEFGSSAGLTPDQPGFLDSLSNGITSGIDAARAGITGALSGLGDGIGGLFGGMYLGGDSLVGPGGITGIKGSSPTQAPSWFNERAYFDANPDVAASGMGGFQHYKDFGAREGRAISPFGGRFDPSGYLLQNQDVKAAGMDPFQHFFGFGMGEGRNLPLTDAATYFNGLQASPYFSGTNADPYFNGASVDLYRPGVTPTIGPDGTPTYGAPGTTPTQQPGLTPNIGPRQASTVSAGQLAPLIDPEAYLTARPDVRAAGMSPAEHFLRFGQYEDTPLTLGNGQTFNARAYLAANPDVAMAGFNPLEHFVNFGAREGRLGNLPMVPTPTQGAPGPTPTQGAPGATPTQGPPGLTPNVAPRQASTINAGALASLIDPEAYLTARPDVRAAGMSPAEHYLRYGQYEDTPLTLGNGLKFNAGAYFATNPDVKASGMGAFDHFAAFGSGEGRVGGFFDGSGQMTVAPPPPSGGWGGLLSGAFGISGPQGNAPAGIGASFIPQPTGPRTDAGAEIAFLNSQAAQGNAQQGYRWGIEEALKQVGAPGSGAVPSIQPASFYGVGPAGGGTYALQAQNSLNYLNTVNDVLAQPLRTQQPNIAAPPKMTGGFAPGGATHINWTGIR